jgi:hypothetical protein
MGLLVVVVLVAWLGLSALAGWGASRWFRWLRDDHARD